MTLEERFKAAMGACKLIVDAYQRGEDNGGSIDWNDLNDAWKLAKEATVGETILSIAQSVSRTLDGDGMQWTTKEGVEFAELCKFHGGVDERNDKDHDAVKWTFPDESIIAVNGDAWDLGHADCWCWVEHTDECLGR